MYYSVARYIHCKKSEEGCTIIYITGGKLVCASRKPEETYQVIFLLVDTSKSVVFYNLKNVLLKFSRKEGKKQISLHSRRIIDGYT